MHPIYCDIYFVLPSAFNILRYILSCRAIAIYVLPINLRYIYKRVSPLIVTLPSTAIVCFPLGLCISQGAATKHTSWSRWNICQLEQRFRVIKRSRTIWNIWQSDQCFWVIKSSRTICRTQNFLASLAADNLIQDCFPLFAHRIILPAEVNLGWQTLNSLKGSISSFDFFAPITRAGELCVMLWIHTYGSFSPGRGKWAKCVLFFFFLKLHCDQTVWFFKVFSTVLKRLCLLESKSTFVLVLAIFFF